MQAWHKLATPREEVRRGRSFNPDEFAINLSQVVLGEGPPDYVRPDEFFSRTSLTAALAGHLGMALRRLNGDTKASPVMTLMTQFGGGKTHTLTALWHLARAGADATRYDGIGELLSSSGLKSAPKAATAVFVGTAWDPHPGAETPWVDIARQLAGDDGVSALGLSSESSPPGTDALQKVFRVAGRPCLILVDEALNYLNRHRESAEHFHAFLQNLTVAAMGVERTAVVLSLPRSQVEMTGWDEEWQQKIERIVRRVAKDLIVADEGDVADVVCRRLFSDLGEEKERWRTARLHAQWCLDNGNNLPPERVASGRSAKKLALEDLANGFHSCYPFHPATLSVFQRKWQGLEQYQQTRGTLAMLAQWVSLAYQSAFNDAHPDSLITLGSAPLSERDFRAVVLGQLGEPRLAAALAADLWEKHSHAAALDADTRGARHEIHRRAGAAIFFESSGGQQNKVARLPELRYALGGPDLDVASIDDAVFKFEKRAYYLRREGDSGYKFGFKPTIKKLVSDRRASLNEEEDVLPRMCEVVRRAFEKKEKGASLSFFPQESSSVADAPRLTLAVLDPSWEWSPEVRAKLSEWTTHRDSSPRLYPAALVWCVKKAGRDLREKTEWALAWESVRRDLGKGVLGSEFSQEEQVEIKSRVLESVDAAQEEVWASYRYAVLLDRDEEDKLKLLDLGSGHSSSGNSLCERVLTALRGNGLLNESVGAAYLMRKWPDQFKESGAWPLLSLRKNFLDGSLPRLPDPDEILRRVLPEYVLDGEFGLAFGVGADGGYGRVCFEERVSSEDIDFAGDVFLLTKKRAQALKSGLSDLEKSAEAALPKLTGSPESSGGGAGEANGSLMVTPEAEEGRGDRESKVATFRVSGEIPSEAWNRVGTKLVSKFRDSRVKSLHVDVDFQVKVEGGAVARDMREEWSRALADLKLSDKVRIQQEDED